jgi:DNA-binding transcriptional LysR family regulator
MRRGVWQGEGTPAMNLKQIEVFRAIMNSRSTIGAAALLGLSQSAVSRQLAQLEAELGFELFMRSKGRLIMRPDAEALLGEMQPLADLLGRVTRFAQELKTGFATRSLLKIGVPQSLATTLMPRVVHDFLAARPGLSVELLAGSQSALEQLVATREADLAFVRLPPENRGFAQRPLIWSGAVCVMPRDHPLAALSVVKPADLAGHDMVLVSRHRPVRDEIETVFSGFGVRMSCRVQAHSVAAACAMVAAGLGVTIVTRYLGLLVAAPSVELRPFEPAMRNSYGIISLEGTPLSIAAEHLTAQLAEQLEELLA